MDKNSKRKVMDCRKYPSEMNCSLVISGTEDEVVVAAAEHAVSVHGETDSPKLRETIRMGLTDEKPDSHAYSMNQL